MESRLTLPIVLKRLQNVDLQLDAFLLLVVVDLVVYFQSSFLCVP